MKILLAHPSSELYGSDRMALLALRALLQAGHTVTAVVPADGPLNDMMAESGAQVIVAEIPVLRKSDLNVRGTLKLAGNSLRSLMRIARIIKSVRPNTVYVNTIVQPWWIVAAKLCRRPIVVHVREAEVQARSLIRRFLYAPLLLADLIVCNSKATRQEITPALSMSAKQVIVIYNGKDWSEYRTARSARPASSGQSPTRLTVVGRLSPRKGQDIAIRALAEIVSAGYDATLTLVGSVFPSYECYENALKQTAAELGVAERTTFLGFRKDIRLVLHTTDIAIVPSRIEPFGTVAAECMAAGLLTIVGDVQGLTEIVVNGKNGLTFQVDDHHALAQRCIWAISNPQQSAALASAGEDDVNNRFGLDRYEREIVKAIESIGAVSA